MPPLGLGYLASFYERNKQNSDFEIEIQTHKLWTPAKSIAKRLQGAELVGITCLTPTYNKALALCKEIKQRSQTPILLGGHHISALPHTLPTHADIAVIGEGEQTFLELLELYERYGFARDRLKGIKGIAYHDGGEVRINDRRELIEPMDKIPFPARNLLPMQTFGPTGHKVEYKRGTIILTSRGCPYKCVYCSPQNFWGCPRFFSAEYVLSEMKEVIEKYKIEVLAIADDLFMANKPRFREIVDLIERERINRQVEFTMDCRTDYINEEVCELLKRMNVTLLSFGFESGCEKTLSYLKKGTVTVAQNRRAIQLCKKYGIRCHGNFIIGAPGETREDVLETMNFVRNNFLKDPDWDGWLISIFLTTPLPGTELWEYAKSRGLVDDFMNWDRLAKLEPIWTGRCFGFKDTVVVSDKLAKEELWELTEGFLHEMENHAFSSFASSFRLKYLGTYIRDFYTRPRDFWYKARGAISYRLRRKVKDTLSHFLK